MITLLPLLVALSAIRCVYGNTQDLPILTKWRTELSHNQEKNSNLKINHLKIANCEKSAKVTFILTTSGTQSCIISALESLLLLNDCRWRLLVIYYDHTKTTQKLYQQPPPLLHMLPTYISRDPRVFFVPYEGSTTKRNDGELRNAAFPFVESEWIGFLDEDVSLTSDYIDQLHTETQRFPSAVAVVFRTATRQTSSPILPRGGKNDITNITFGNFGTSFAVRREILQPNGIHRFISDSGEYYKLLADIHHCESPSAASIVVSAKVCYKVQGYEPSPLELSQHIPMHESIALTGLNACNRDAIPLSPPPRPIFGFRFPEDNAAINGGDSLTKISGFRQALLRLRSAKCVDEDFFSSMDIELHFNIDTDIVKKDYLHVQVISEQKDFIKKYSKIQMRKIRWASQIWASTVADYWYLINDAGLENVMYVPMTNFLDISTVENGSSRKTMSTEMTKYLCNSHVVKNSEGHQCSVLENSDTTCNRTAYSTSMQTKHCQEAFDVIAYGYAEEDSSRLNKHICQKMSDDFQSFDCFASMSEPALERVAARTSIVLLLRHNMSLRLDTHTINNLLKLGKVLVAIRSDISDVDFDIENIYGRRIILVDNYEDVKSKVQKLLADKSQVQMISADNIEFMREQSAYIEHLCAAFSQLRYHAVATERVNISTSKRYPREKARNS